MLTEIEAIAMLDDYKKKYPCIPVRQAVDPLPICTFINYAPPRGRVTVTAEARASSEARGIIQRHGPRFYVYEDTPEFYILHACAKHSNSYWFGALPKEWIKVDHD